MPPTLMEDPLNAVRSFARCLVGSLCGRTSRCVVASLALLLTLGACDSSTVSAPSDRIAVEFRTSGALRGLEGEELPASITVVTTDGEGRPRPGAPVELRVVAGGGSVEPTGGTTDGQGRLPVTWRLGPSATGPQRLEVRVTGPGGGARAAVEATALGPGDTDVVIVRGASRPLKGALVVDEDAAGALNVRQKRATADTVVPLFPIQGGRTLLAVFPTVEAPHLREVSWTSGIDTVTVDLDPPVRVDLTIRIFAGPFEERKRVAEEHLDATERVWEAEGVGVILGSVTFSDLSGGGDRVELESDGLCERVGVRGTIRVDYVHSIDDDGFWGWGCAPSQAYMGLPSEQAPRLLAHELGHVFTLPHRSDGLMNPNRQGSTLTEGEIFQIHFDARSGINAVFGAHPEAVLRECEFGSQRRCLPLDLTF